ncbi:MAG: hypothetical protein MUE40_01575 [Anaerolineae bacterium]|nr:hypothetical protein [Anaerolineae bacterium]
MQRSIPHWLLTAAVAALLLLAAGLLAAQEAPPAATADPDCTPARLKEQQELFAMALNFDFENNPTISTENLFRLGVLYQQLAVRCGFAPAEQDVENIIDLTLEITTLEAVIAARATGDNVEEVLAELENYTGDPLMGQLLYNGLEPTLDGATLTCMTCHQGVTAPTTEASWTRTVEVRLADSALAGYTAEQYLVESILRPSRYIAPGYNDGLMPNTYGTRLDMQMLADILAFLESQDQPVPPEG